MDKVSEATNFQIQLSKSSIRAGCNGEKKCVLWGKLNKFLLILLNWKYNVLSCIQSNVRSILVRIFCKYVTLKSFKHIKNDKHFTSTTFIITYIKQCLTFN